MYSVRGSLAVATESTNAHFSVLRNFVLLPHAWHNGAFSSSWTAQLDRHYDCTPASWSLCAKPTPGCTARLHIGLTGVYLWLLEPLPIHRFHRNKYTSRAATPHGSDG